MAPAKVAALGAVERKIHFYRIVTECDEAGKPVPFPLGPVLTHLNKLSFAGGDRYLAETDGRVTCCWVDRMKPHERLRVANIRRSGLPQLEREGMLSPLPIPRASGLMEPIHVVFFGKAIVGTDFNFYGPRISRLGLYLGHKANGVCPSVAFEPLLRQDVLARLERLEDVRLFQLRIRPHFASAVAQAQHDLGGAFNAAERVAQVDDIEIILRRRPKTRGPFDALLGFAKRLVKRSDLHDGVSRFVVRGVSQETGQVEQLDLLSDELIVRKQIVRLDERSRALHLESAYRAIEEAYQELRSELRAAIGATE